VFERGLMAVRALFLVVCSRSQVVLVVIGAVVGMAKVLGGWVLSQLMALKSLRYQTGPLVGRVLARVMGGSYGSVALVARGKDAVALRQRDIGRVQAMLRGSRLCARKDRIRRAGLGASQVRTSRLHEEAQDIGRTAAALPLMSLSD
jgi:hypothetical protein